MSSWKECKLGDIINFGNGRSRPKIEGEYPIYGGNGILGYANEFNYTDETIILGRVGAYCGSVYYENKPIWVSDNALSAKPKEGNHSKFLYYFLKNMDLNSHAGGSSHPLITQSLLNSLNVEICTDFEEQKAIAEVLSSLDDKIDLLHRQNQTLESLAQTIFRQWFEDKEFDGIIGDIIKLQSGYAFKSKDFQDFGIHGVLKIKNISNSIIDIFNTDFIDLTVANKTDEKFKILSGDILFGMTGAEIGKMGIVPKTDKNLWLNQRVGVLREKYLGAKYLAYLQLTSEFGFDYITNTATGSAQPNISASEIEQCPFVKLEVDEIENYSNEISPLFEKIIFNLGQIQTLENLRDTLLPKLLSGEVRVEI